MDKDTNEVKLIPTQSVLVTVRGQQLPQNVYIHYVRCEVHCYIQNVIQCKKCLRFGHFQDQCKGSVRCEICGNNHDLKECKNTEIKCINCGGTNHMASDQKLCPRYKKEKLIKQIMAESNISYLEAKNFFDNGNSFSAIAGKDAPNIDNLKEFPIFNKNTGGYNRPFATTVSYRRATKRHRLLPPNFDKQELQNLLIEEEVKKNVPGGLVPQNPYRPNEVNKLKETFQNNDNLDIVFEAVYSIIKSVNPNELNKITDEGLKNMIKERVINLNEAI